MKRLMQKYWSCAISTRIPPSFSITFLILVCESTDMNDSHIYRCLFQGFCQWSLHRMSINPMVLIRVDSLSKRRGKLKRNIVGSSLLSSSRRHCRSSASSYTRCSISNVFNTWRLQKHSHHNRKSEEKECVTHLRLWASEKWTRTTRCPTK